MSIEDANDAINRKTAEVAVIIHRTFKTGTLEELDGGVLLHALVAVTLGSCLAAPEPGEGVVTTTAPPLLHEDASKVLDACRSIVGDGGDTLDGDCLCALLQAALYAMRPALLAAMAEHLEDTRKAN